MFAFFRKKRRAKILETPFSGEWEQVLVENVPYYPLLSQADQQELRNSIQIFIAEKQFEGCNDLKITDEIKVTIAAEACLLLLHRNHNFYPKVKTILVYPGLFKSRQLEYGPGGELIESCVILAGQAWQHGTVILAWDQVEQGSKSLHDGHNVTIHEFAHQLDLETGDFNCVPILSRSAYFGWIRVMGREYNAFVNKAKKHKKTLLNKYGATNPAEFFAVLTEYFFEKPTALKKKHPELYEQMQIFFQQDPDGVFNKNK